MSEQAFPVGDPVYVTNPTPRHSHMLGAKGRVMERKGDAYKVRFYGSSGWFEAGELSLTPVQDGEE